MKHILSLLLLALAAVAQAQTAAKPVIQGEYINGRALASVGGKYGVVDTEGNILVPMEYDWLTYAFTLDEPHKGELPRGLKGDDNYYRGSRNGRKGYVCGDGAVPIPFQFDQLKPWPTNASLMLATVDYKKGLLALNGNVIADCIYDELADKGDSLVLAIKDGKRGIINEHGRVIVPIEYNEVGGYVNGLLWASNDGKHYRLYNYDGTAALPYDISEAYYYLRAGDLRRKMTRTFKELPVFLSGPLPKNLPTEYYIEVGGKVGTIAFRDGGKCHITITPDRYEHITEFAGGLAYCRAAGKWGVIREDGTEVQPCIYTTVINSATGQPIADDNIAAEWPAPTRVAIGNKKGLLRADGTTQLRALYDSIGNYVDSLVLVKSDGLYRYFDEKGEDAFAIAFPWASDFSEGLAAVKDDKGRFYFIDETGQTVIKPKKYDRVEAFRGGRCRVHIDGKTWFINRKGDRAR